MAGFTTTTRELSLQEMLADPIVQTVRAPARPLSAVAAEQPGCQVRRKKTWRAAARPTE